MKKINFYCILLSAILSINSVFAQFEINSFETTQIDSTTQEERDAMFFYKNYPDKFFNNNSINTTKKYNFTVILLNGNTVDVKSQIFLNEDNHYILNGLDKIYPKNTEQIIAHFDDYDFIGVPNDFCWLFRTNDDNDPVYTYSILPKNSSKSVLFIKSRTINTAPVFLSQENVIDVIKNDKIALEYALKNRLIYAIKQYNIRNYSTLK